MEEKNIIEKDKNPGGRPSKLKNFIEAFKQVLSKDEGQVVYLTDDELRIICNDLLEEEAQISDATFENRKAGKLKDTPEYREFLGLYKKALLNQKSQLFIKLQTDPQSWQRFAWIIERKFSEWNLKSISEVDNKISGELKTTSSVDKLNELLK